MRNRKIWRVRQADPALQYIFQHELGISPVLAALLTNRGIDTVEEARLFLEVGLDRMHDPFQMADMDKAVGRIKLALEQGEKILIYGDYDADGTTATALLVKVLDSLGGETGYYVPNRMEEGYGLHLEALRRAGRDGFSLVVTVDCGISAFEEVALNSAERGPDIIITDHHEPPEKIPGAVAVINPKRVDCPYRFKELAGVGVALKLAQALLLSCSQKADEWIKYLDIACLGTVADIVPLTGENRIIVKYGLPALAGTVNTGIRSLIEVSGIKTDDMDTNDVGFALAPRLNAAGRIGDAGLAVDLFLTGDPGEAGKLADILDRGNRERQKIESMVLADAMGMLDANPEMAEGRVIVLASEGWHSGVVGIVASRLVEKYYRPVIMISLEGDKGKGSGRSIPGFHLYNALSGCSDHLVKFGGHAQAAGLALSAGKVEKLRSALNEYAARVPGEVFLPGLDLDAVVSLEEVTEGLIEEIQKIAPFGYCNPGPVLACRGVGLASCREIGKNGGHLKLLIREKSTVMDGIAFKLASCADEIAAAEEIDVAFLPSINEWRGKRSVQLVIRDIRPAAADWEINGTGNAENMEVNNNIFSGAVRSLERMGPLALLPEFISAILRYYMEIYPQFPYPGKYLQFFSKINCRRENQPVEKLRMIMGWGCKYKSADLLSLLDSRGGNVVLVGSPARAVEIAAFLNRSGVPSVYMHSGVLPDEAVELREAFVSGPAVAVACTYETFVLLNAIPRKVVLFDLPYGPEDLARALGDGAVAHNLSGEEDIASGIEYLDSVAPGRDCLAQFYRYLAGLGGEGYLDIEQAVLFLRERGLVRAGQHTLAFGLSVFSELGIVNCRREGEGYIVKLIPAGMKRDINSCGLFRAGQEIRVNAGIWWEKFKAAI